MSQIDVEIELAALLSSLSFNQPIPHERMGVPVGSSDISMNDDDMGYQSDSTDVSSSSIAQARSSSPHPCAILQAFACYHGSSIDAVQTIGDAELSQLVFMHREAFMVCRSAHTGCSQSFKELAFLFEKRMQQPSGERLGMDAVGMLRAEAWLLSG